MPRFVLAVILLLGCAATSYAQDAPAPQPNPEKNPATLVKRGPDELFTDIPIDGLNAGAIPEKQFKTVLIRVANVGSFKKSPDEDLKSSYRPLAGAVRLRAEQLLEYAPHIYSEENIQRVEFFKARFRTLETPRANSPVQLGKSYAGPIEAARTFNAEYIVMLSFERTESGANAGIYVHQRGKGLISAKSFPLLKPQPGVASFAITHIQTNTDSALKEIIQVGEDEAKQMPNLVLNDAALKPFVKMRGYMEVGELKRAYVEFETVNNTEPANGRVALYAIEIFRGMAGNENIEAEHHQFLQRSIKTGREALAKNPNEVLLRGRLAWNSLMFYGRKDWALSQLKIAMKVQPASMSILRWHATIENWTDKNQQTEWLKKHALPHIKDGRVEFEIGNVQFGIGDQKSGVEWYRKALKLQPGEHEYQLSMGLCATYLAEKFSKKVMPGASGAETRKQRDAAYDEAATALETAQEIDPTVVKWVYEYHVRAATHSFQVIPSNESRRYRVFLSQSVINGLENSSRTWEWKRLVKDIIDVWARKVRKDCGTAKPEDPLYSIKMQARLVFSMVDNDVDDRIATLWEMREQGIRTVAYYAWMNTLGSLVDGYKPAKDEPAESGE